GPPRTTNSPTSRSSLTSTGSCGRERPRAALTPERTPPMPVLLFVSALALHVCLLAARAFALSVALPLVSPAPALGVGPAFALVVAVRLLLRRLPIRGEVDR